MALTKLTETLNKISTLATLITGQAPTVKAAFDYDVNVVKDYINDTLVPEIEDTFETKDNITDNRKLSATGDFTGTWNGHEMVETDPGIQAIVNEHTNRLNNMSIDAKNPPLLVYISHGRAKGNANYYNAGVWYEDSAHTILSQDDCDIIQACSDYLDDLGGGRLIFPQANYLIKGKQTTLVDGSRLTDGIRIKSNIIYEGINATLRCDVNCCYVFDTALRTAVTDISTNLHDITIRGLTFDKPNATWFQESHLINVESITNLLVEDCKFKGWSGDAIQIGALINSGLSAWLQSYVENVRIINCDFDGVTKNNRQAISFIHGKNILVDSCNFKRTTRTDMPGAIDIEPEHSWCIIEDIHIKNCIFEDIGGSVGVVGFALTNSLTVRPKNLSIKDCIFKKNTNPYSYAIAGRRGADEENIVANSPLNITFSYNTHVDNYSSCWFSISGVENISIINETFEGNSNLTGASKIGYTGTSEYAPIKGFYLKKNVVKNYIFEGATNESPITFYGNILSGSISDNEFIDCGNKSSGVNNIFRVFNMVALKSKNLLSHDNKFINSSGFNNQSYPFYTSGLLAYPATIILGNNDFLGMNPYKYDGGKNWYETCKVKGAEGIVSSGEFNNASGFTALTLPDSFPIGTIYFKDGNEVFENVKISPDNDSRYHNFQKKYNRSYGDKEWMRHPNVSTNTWDVWYEFTGTAT